MGQTQAEYFTSDIYEASSLVAAGVQLVRVDPGFGGRKEFVFPDTEDAAKAVNDYVNATLVLNIQTFIGAWRRLRRAVDDNGGNIRYEKFKR